MEKPPSLDTHTFSPETAGSRAQPFLRLVENPTPSGREPDRYVNDPSRGWDDSQLSRTPADP